MGAKQETDGDKSSNVSKEKTLKSFQNFWRGRG
jgi:hypothetical protein